MERTALTPRAFLAVATLWTAVGLTAMVAGYGQMPALVSLGSAVASAILGVLAARRRDLSWTFDAGLAVTSLGMLGLILLSGETSIIMVGLGFLPSIGALAHSRRLGERWFWIVLAQLGVAMISQRIGWPEAVYEPNPLANPPLTAIGTLVMLSLARDARGRLDAVAQRASAGERAAIERSKELDTLRAQLEEKNAELDRTNAELVEARQRAEGRAQQAVDFLSHMTHEIRTPLNGVLGMTDALLAMRLGDEVREHIGVLASSGRLLRRLVDDVLELARLDAGKLQLIEEAFDPHTIVEDVVDLFAPQATAKGIQLVAIPPEAPVPRLVGDALRIRQIVQNLVSNAVKFTEKGSVRVRFDCPDTGVLTVEVTDTGPGMGSETLAGLFREYHQHRDGTRRGGTGLGLAIARRLALAMRGDVTVSSAVGRGSTFSAEVRTRAASIEASDVPEPSRSFEEVSLLESDGDLALSLVRTFGRLGVVVWHATTVAELERLRGKRPSLVVLGRTAALALVGSLPWAVPVELHTGTATTGAAHTLQLPPRRARAAKLMRALHGKRSDSLRGPPPAEQGFTALVVDDEPVNVRVLSLLLKQRGWNVEACTVGAEAVERARTRTYDLAFIDLNMPGLDGTETARGIVAVTRRMPWLVLHSAADKGVEPAARAAGFVDFLRKPIDVRRLGLMTEHAGRFRELNLLRLAAGLPPAPEGRARGILQALHVAHASEDVDAGHAALGELRLYARKRGSEALETACNRLEQAWPDLHDGGLLVEIERIANPPTPG